MADSMWKKYPLALEDRPYKPTEQNTIFVRHSTVFGDGQRTALGTGFYRYIGMQYLAIFFLTGSGHQSLYEHADEMVAYYTDRRAPADGTTVMFQVASTIKLPADSSGFSQLQVICPFYFDTRS